MRGVNREFLKEGKISEELIYDDYPGLTIQPGLIREGSPLSLLGLVRAGDVEAPEMPPRGRSAGS
jgi:hypothetical protein